MFKKLKITFLAFAIGVFLSFAAVAMAASTSSTVKYFGPYLGYSYSNQATVSNDYGVRGYAEISTQSGSVPAGYMGVSSYLYTSSGAMVEYSDWYYNATSSGGVGTYTPLYSTSGSYYYADGLTKVYNGNGYTSVYTNITPNLYY